MIRKCAVVATLIVLVACSQGGSASPEKGNSNSCGAIEKERATFRQQVKEKAEKLRAEMRIDKSKLKSEAYPKLADTQKLMEFQTEVEGGENMFTVRLSECSKG